MQKYIHTLHHPFNIMLALSIITLLITSPTAQAKTFSNPDFEKALERARIGAKWLNNSLIKPKDGSTIPLVKEIQRLETGKWKVLINGAWLTSSSSYEVVTYSGVVVNHGDRFEYAFLGQPTAAHLTESIRNHKGMVKAEKAWIKKHKDLTVKVGTDGNRVTLAGAYTYADNLGALADRLEWLFNASNGILVWTEYANRDVEKDYTKDLDNNKLTYLSSTDFALLAQDLRKFKKKRKSTKEGYYDFKNEGRNIRVFNYGERTVVSYHRRIPDSITGENRTEVLTKIQKFVEKNKVTHASSQEARWYNLKKPTFVWVRAEFTFDGTLKGKEFSDGYWDFKNKFAEKVDKEISKIIKDYE
jgi:hypothetical protein